jgi:hypothetical protein
LDGAAHSLPTPTTKPISSSPDLPDHE